MRARSFLPFVLSTLFVTPAVQAGGGPPIEVIARRAVSGDAAEAAEAIAMLRRIGPPGLDALAAQRATLDGRDAGDPALRARFDAALDAVAQQRGAARARLYWYTDLDEARAAARASGKPILSLRMLGKLTDELSCANSRFFRTVLYANEDVSRALRERFVLHWRSVRPVPKVTIDMGDGRTICRTITGNSAHYVLDAEGRVIDAIPGLYGPKTFLREIGRAEVVARATAGADLAGAAWIVRRYHATRLQELGDEWAKDMAALGFDAPPVPDGNGSALSSLFLASPPSAAEAGEVAFGKSMVERPLLRAIDPDTARRLAAPAEIDGMNDAMWSRIALLHAGDARLDDASRKVVASELPDAVIASRVAVTKNDIESPLVRVVRRFERSVAEDTVRNEYRLHRRIHEWLANEPPPADVETLNERVYAELFLTPSSDPWLGLVDPEVYAALEKGGIVE